MSELANQIPSYVHSVLQVLAAAGKHGYPVGGCVRDILRGVTPNDFDMTADATPEEMQEIFRDMRVIPTGLAHGTVTVISDGHPIEITTHRHDGKYLDKRHPESVCFTTSIEEDLARRDFTVNAMAWSAERGIIDPFGGQDDIKRGLLRAVGNPEARFLEDALRILRCFRFVAKLGFQIEEKTAAAARKCRAGLAQISVERILKELAQLLVAPHAREGLAALFAADCTAYIFGEATVNETAAAVLPSLPEDPALRLAALLADNRPDALRTLCKRLHAPNALTDALVAYVAALPDPIPTSPYEARRYVCTHYPHFRGVLQLKSALYGTDTKNALALTEAVLRDRTAVELRRLAVNGKELQEALGILPRHTGRLLAALQELVWQEPTCNRRSTLLAAAKEITKEDPSYYA